MATKTIATILTLKDKMSAPLGKTTEQMKLLRKQAQLSVNQINKFGRDANSAFLRATSATAKFAATSATILGSMAAKTGLSEAMDLEGYKMQLETATKDTKKASDIMRYAVNMANKTPYEGGELVQGAAKFEAMGLSAKRFLPLVGDMAAATNKSFDQAAEAMIDAQAGELERFKEFGITKVMIAKKADEMFKGQMVINNKGQIADQAKFNQALENIMIDKFKGGMDKQSQTLKGTWSTVTGITKSALAEMFGMTSDGTIRTASMFDSLKTKVGEVAKQFEKWQSDGTFIKLGNTITSVADGSFKALSVSVKFVKENFNWLAPVLAGTVAAFTAMNVINKVVAMYKVLKTALFITTAAQAGLNATMALSPIGIAVLAIAGLVAAGTALYLNFDKVSAAAKQSWEWFNNLISKIPDFAFVLAGPLAPLLLMIKHFKEVKEMATGAIGAVKNFFGVDQKDSSGGGSRGTYEAPKTNGGSRGAYKSAKADKKDKDTNKIYKAPKMEMFAKGGYASKPSICGEAGGEWIIPDNGSARSKQILSQASASVGGGSKKVSLTIAKIADTIVIREEADIDKLANAFANKLKQAAFNM